MSGSIAESLKPIVPTWSHQNGVFICAQPGRGKTTFIKEEIIPAAVERGKNVLLLSSLLANSVQHKRLIAQKLGLQTSLEGLSEIGLQRHTDFVSVRIMTYQSVQGFLNDSDAKNGSETVHIWFAMSAISLRSMRSLTSLRGLSFGTWFVNFRMRFVFT